MNSITTNHTSIGICHLCYLAGLVADEQLDAAYQEVKDVVAIGRGIGLWGDMVVTLQNGDKIEMRAIPRQVSFGDQHLRWPGASAVLSRLGGVPEDCWRGTGIESGATSHRQAGRRGQVSTVTVRTRISPVVTLTYHLQPWLCWLPTVECHILLCKYGKPGFLLVQAYRAQGVHSQAQG